MAARIIRISVLKKFDFYEFKIIIKHGLDL